MSYNINGTIKYKIVDGTTSTGLFASDGSFNIVLDDSTHSGVYHPCGAFRVNSLKGSTAYDTSGAFYINHILGSFGGSNDVISILGSDVYEYWDAARADTIASITDSTYTDAVSSWTGLITGANLAQSTPLLKPWYSSTGLAGGPCITFDGTQQYLTCTDSAFLAILPTGATPCEIWVLGSQDVAAADATTRHVAGYAASSVINGRSLARLPVTSVNRARAYTGTGAAATTATDTHVDLSGVHVLRGIYGATVTSVDVDSNAPVTASVVPVTSVPTLFRVGAIPASAASNYWQGKVAVVLVTKPLSTAKAAILHRYLG